MPHPIIQDSDGSSSDVESPIKPTSPDALEPSRSSHPLNTSSTTFLTSEANKAHESLMEPSPNSAPVSHSDSISNVFLSPTMSKITRRQTTMEQVGSQKRKKQITYGSKTTLDDIGLHRSPTNGFEFRDDDEVSLIPEKKKRRLDSGKERSSGSLLVPSGTNQSLQTDASPINFTPHLEVGERATHLTSSQIELTPHAASGSVTLSQAVDAGLDAIESVLHEPEMAINQDHSSKDEYTSLGDQIDGPAAETVPIISMETPTFDEHESFVQSQDKNGPSGDVEATEHEQALPAPNCNPSQRSARSDNVFKARDQTPKPKSNTKRSRKDLSDDENSDGIELGMPPRENYKPRPGRSRRGDVSDDFIASIDFSAVPGRASKKKSKIQRRRTTTDIPIQISDDEDDDDGFDIRQKHKRKQIEREPEVRQLDADHKSVEDIKEQSHKSPETEPEPKKKKRGRPKKDAVVAEEQPAKTKHDEEEAIAIAKGDAIEPQKENSPTEPDPESAPAPKKRGRKKKVPEEPALSEEKVIDDPESDVDELQGFEEPDNDDDEEDDAPKPAKKRGRPKLAASTNAGETNDAPKPAKRGRPKSTAKETIESDNSDNPKPAKRGRKKSTLTVHEDEDDDEHEKNSPTKAAPDPTALQDKSAAVNGVNAQEPSKSATPNKQIDAKERHSPLSKGRVPYRVGLSKTARIEPLLKIKRR